MKHQSCFQNTFATVAGLLLALSCNGNDPLGETIQSGSTALTDRNKTAIHPMERSFETTPRSDVLGGLSFQIGIADDEVSQGDECCTEPGQAAECWHQDAIHDSVRCSENTDCAPGNICNADGLCTCSSEAHCKGTDFGGDHPQASANGICRDDNVCGPSWCNGYFVCSCWGGCVWWTTAPPDDDGNMFTPADMCSNNGLGCDNGQYPYDPEQSGFCSGTIVDPCQNDAECNDNNPCTSDHCDPGHTCTNDFGCYYEVDTTQNCSLSTSDPRSEDCVDARCAPIEIDGCVVGASCDGPAVNAGGFCVDNPHDVDASWYGMGPRHIMGEASCYLQNCDAAGQCNADASLANNLVCAEDDGNPCTDELCWNGQCTHNPDAHVGEDCDLDGNPCTLDECDPAGDCTYISDKDCDDENECTTDACDPADGLCVNDDVPDGTPCGGDGDVCTLDDSCQGGVCTSGDAKTCIELWDQCNYWICDPTDVDTDGEGECVRSNEALLGSSCNADGDGCTQDECVCLNPPCDDPDGNYELVCTNVGQTICDDLNECTEDYCDPADGQCKVTFSDEGTACNADSNGCTRNDACNGAGGCLAGEPITGEWCLLNDPTNCPAGCDLDCNTASCTDLGNAGNNFNAFECAFAGLSGECDADDDPCTLDICDTTGPAPQECVAGPPRDCSFLDNQCRFGSCDPLDGDCVADFQPLGALCNADSNGCTENDYCDGGGMCAAGSLVSCEPEPTDPCHEYICQSDGADPAFNSHTCIPDADLLPGCCESDAECSGCTAALAADGGCCTPRCGDDGSGIGYNVCYLEIEPYGTACTDIDDAVYPPNCYEGFCGVTPTGIPSGICEPVMHAAYNNLCSDAFIEGDITAVDKGSDSWIGEFSKEDESGTTLEIIGSTTCASNNYEAIGEHCVEDDGTDTPLGQTGPDLVYAFSYPTNAADEYILWSYVVKVQADFDVGVYVAQDIHTAEDCPEGNQPDNDYAHVQVSSERCNYPHASAVAVTEDDCDDTGNTLAGQQCCYPNPLSAEEEQCGGPTCTGTTGDGKCGYYWCRRYYPTGCCNYEDGEDCEQKVADGTCDGRWDYPENPHDCTQEVPGGMEAFDYVASAVIFPEGRSSGETRTVFIFMDGAQSDKGNFYLTVEKRKWSASPCDRVNDDPRVFDVTHPGVDGATWTGTLENVVNSMHAGGGDCGGYNCANSWSGRTSCHASGSANEFWPNTEIFKIHRGWDEGNANYCIKSEENFLGAADLVGQIYRRSYSGATTICDESYYNVGCGHDDVGNNLQFEFVANAGQLYLVEFSQYAHTTRVCDPGLGDDCLYEISVYEGSCPMDCLPPWETPQETVTITEPDGCFTADSTVQAADGNHYNPPGIDGDDEIWEVNNVTAEMQPVTITVCPESSWNMGLSIYDCEQNRLQDNNIGGAGACETASVEVLPGQNQIYVNVDSYGASGAYSIEIKWGNGDCSEPDTDTDDNFASCDEAMQAAHYTFEGCDDQGWTLEGDWAVGTPGVGVAYEGSCTIATNLGAAYSMNADDEATSPTIDTTACIGQPVYLHFFMWRDIEGNSRCLYDWADVQVYNGSSWITVSPFQGYDYELGNRWCGNIDTGIQPDWIHNVVDVSFAMNENLQIRYRMHSDGSIAEQGLFVDLIWLDDSSGTELCGNGWPDTGEQCDDGNSDNTDACLTDCTDASCGDGFTWVGQEQCDNGSGNSDNAPNACRTNCQNPSCGDGVTDTGETCDDGGTVNGDGCDQNCQLESVCGNNVVEGVEECDDGPANSDTAPDTCRENCKNPYCGDSVIDSGETCDDGNVDSSDACVACADAICGDGHVRTGVEDCDDGAANNNWQPNHCRPTCVLPTCGDGVTDGNATYGEACDEGAAMPTASCDNCAIPTGFCGDGAVGMALQVKDDFETGDLSALDWEVQNWAVNTEQQNNGSYSLRTTNYNVNNSLAVAAVEAYSDGEVCFNYWGETELNYDYFRFYVDGAIIWERSGIFAAAWAESCHPVSVGVHQFVWEYHKDSTTHDGHDRIYIDDLRFTAGDYPEQCDDGDTATGDGCNAFCLDETCGNGTIDEGEECDDGGTADNDGCSVGCAIEYCGNGELEIVPEAVEDFESGDLLSQPWDWIWESTSRTKPFVVTDDDAAGGTYSAVSSNKRMNNSRSELNLIAYTDGQVCFDWRGSSQTNADLFQFIVDTTVVFSRSGDHDAAWQTHCEDLAPGVYDFQWVYLKNASSSSNWDRYFIDNIRLAEAYSESCDQFDDWTGGDGCGPTCSDEICGNGIVDPGEECDDANSISTDACVDCADATCGDGFVFAGTEQCDEGSANNSWDPNSCRPDCATPSCGDFVTDDAAPYNEQCDDGNALTTDDCISCSAAYCGDGHVQQGVEECDDGNAVPDDECDNDCNSTIDCSSFVLATFDDSLSPYTEASESGSMVWEWNTGSSPGSGGYAYFDSDFYTVNWDNLISPEYQRIRDCAVVVEYNHDYKDYNSGSYYSYASVQKRSSTSPSWSTVQLYHDASASGFDSYELAADSATDWAADGDDIQIRFRYEAYYAFHWSLDDIKIIGVTGADAEPDTDTDPGPWCNGVEVAGYCWYYGGGGESCGTVCAAHGGYHIATRSYAGSDGSTLNCRDVLDALGIGSGIPGLQTGVGLGCSFYNGNRYRTIDPTTETASFTGYARVCACNE